VEGAPAVRGDAKLLRRAVENLIANAVKYAPRGSEVELGACARSGGGLEITVADRGPGIPDDMKSMMFRKFGSVEARRGEARRGYGLGLHLVKVVASAHRGDVSVHDR